ncbi:DUF3305 domain-containing protein [Roseovarius salinarum]|uniref:DUF3305 domain-containing protein n=1 Tax=Roseovarius salinarum TaxID=1981892 RepID=UPI000C33B0C0|nr:DUF3305 domain-containing protein [Roseovarius salinarum]
MPVGIVVQRSPGVTAWAAWSWKAVAVLPGAGSADWRVLREEGDRVMYHAATPELELHAAETEAYIHGLCAETPSVYAVLRETEDRGRPFDVVLVTASPYEAQDYADSGEEVVEKIPMPASLVDWVRRFAEAHHEEEVFTKRRRDEVDVDKAQDGIGDPRIDQMRDVYRAPRQFRKGRLQ